MQNIFYSVTLFILLFLLFLLSQLFGVSHACPRLPFISVICIFFTSVIFVSLTKTSIHLFFGHPLLFFIYIGIVSS